MIAEWKKNLKIISDSLDYLSSTYPLLKNPNVKTNGIWMIERGFGFLSFSVSYQKLNDE